MSTQKFYNDMTAGEQTRWVNEFAGIIEEHGERIALLGKGKAQMQGDELPWVRNLFELLSAWPFASDFCSQAMRYGDFPARAGRLTIYVNKVKNVLADGLLTKDADGRTVAFVSPSTPLRRRGRPTKEEVAARLRGDALVLSDNSPENEKRRRIAKMLGLEVVVSGEAPREKNNAELKAEREKKKAEEERQNPSLFGDPSPALPREGDSASTISMGEIYQDRIENDRLHLSDIKWLCTKELQERIDNVRAQRTAFGDAAQTAKVLAGRGADKEEISTYAKRADEAREAFESTYAAVDEELAVLHKRLSIDLPYIEKFKARFKGVDMEKVLYITRPYYEKVRKDNPAIDARIKRLIEQDAPEYAAKMKAEEEKKKEVSELVRYITRKDKDASDERVSTMTKRIARLRELMGDEFADTYLPVLKKTKEDNKAWRATKDERQASKKSSNQETKRTRKKKDGH